MEEIKQEKSESYQEFSKLLKEEKMNFLKMVLSECLIF